jgi:hypothetical protein
VKKELRAVAEDFDVEISELKIEVWAPEVSISDKSLGIQARTFPRIEFLARCNASDDWVPASLNWVVNKKNNEWFSIRGSNSGMSAYVPGLAPRVELPYELPPCNLYVDPKNWEERSENRRLLERWERWLRAYIESNATQELSPLAIGPFEAERLLLIGPSWPFVEERRSDLERWFGRPFTDEEIEAFRTDPNKEAQIVTIIAEQESQGKLGDEVKQLCAGNYTLAQFYGMTQNEQGRQVLRNCVGPY